MERKKRFTLNCIEKKYFLLWAGVLLSVLLMLPYCLLGGESIITYHDQLDGELLSYILSAKYLFTGQTIYPELMGGLPANGAVAPAPLFVLFYKVWTPLVAFLFSQWVILAVSFVGMFLLLWEVLSPSGKGTKLAVFMISMIFMLLPFYPVYGLCIPGLPLFMWSVKKLEKEKGKKALCFLALVALYGFASSLVLCGFAVLLVLLVMRRWRAFGVLLCTYLLTNYQLLFQVLVPGEGYVSHKEEIVVSGQPFFESFTECLKNGIDYAKTFHFWMLCILLLAVVIKVCIQRENAKTDLALQCMRKVFYGIVFIILLYSLYKLPSIAQLRNTFGGVCKAFNLERIAWLLPPLWCLLAGYGCKYLLEGEEISSLKRVILSVFAVVALLMWSGGVLLQSALRPNLSKLYKQAKGESYYALDWNKFFAEDVFAQVDEAIGEKKDTYHVVSLGIYPAAAAYYGFYCLDAYSNNYPLSYKHAFRRVIAGELEKSEYVRDFFDHWGNRCYITTAEQANYYTFEKKWNSVINNLAIDTAALKEMDCKYLFSAAYIMNADELGLTLLSQQPFETEDSWYHIYVYRL